MMRLLHIEKNGQRTVKVYRYPAIDEYICRMYVDGTPCVDTDYHTDNKQDALDTAKAMVDPVWPIV